MQHEPPPGFRYVYGELEPLPPPVPDTVFWEVEDFAATCAEAERTHPGRRWQAYNPDGSPIGRPHKKPAAAISFLRSYLRDHYREQGGYRDGRGRFIPYAELFYDCDISPV